LILAVFFTSHSAFAQLSRRSQIEIYTGLALPQNPENFKEFWKTGFSLNFQYVFFPSHRIGIPLFIGLETFTVNETAINNSFRDLLVGFRLIDNTASPVAEITDASVQTEGSAGDLKVGVGIRPYLTSTTSSLQFFLFGNLTFNVINLKREFKEATVTILDLNSGTVTDGTVSERELHADGFETKFEESDGKFGMGLGFGFEMPAGGSINLIFQGVANVIFADYQEFRSEEGKEEYLSFFGITVGVAF
jgi:hypothetical protein